MDNVKKYKTTVPSHLQDAHYKGAEKLGHLIKAEWLDTDVSVVPASGLCSYYMGKDGLIITYHE